MLLFLEILLHLIFQVCAMLVRPFHDLLNQISPLFPISSALLYLLVVLLIFVFQLKKRHGLLLFLKVLEFVLFVTILGFLLLYCNFQFS